MLTGLNTMYLLIVPFHFRDRYLEMCMPKRNVWFVNFPFTVIEWK